MLTVNFATNSAAMSTNAHEKVTPKYKFIDTVDLLNRFANFGWVPVKYSEARTKKYQGYQTHVVTLSHHDDSLTTVGDSSLRILIINNHHASKALRIQVGLFRMVCANGMVVSDADFGGLCIRHMGEDIDARIEEFVDRIKVVAQALRGRINALRSLEMGQDTVKAFARQALSTRFKAEEITDDMVQGVLNIRRPEDASNNAWEVFNRVQENVTQGFRSNDRTRAVRRLTSLKRDLDINERLWDMLPIAA